MIRATLSFDNGPDPRVTPAVLDLLAQRGILAWFFVLGQHLRTEPGRALVRRAHAAGHRIGNHSFSHATPLGDDTRDDAVQREIEATQALLEPLAPGPRSFRPFGGGGVLGPHLLRDDAVEHLCAQAYSCVTWNHVPRDWDDPQGWAARASKAMEELPHAVLVLHDIPGACLDALPAFLDAAAARGVQWTLELPADCLPIVDGNIVADLRPLMTRRAPEGAKGEP